MTAPDALLREALDEAQKVIHSEFCHGKVHSGYCEAIGAVLATTPPASAARDAVVEAAKAWFDSAEEPYTDEGDALTDAVDALRAAETRE
jgi:hypothetical protein